MNKKIIVPAIAIFASGIIMFGIPKPIHAQTPGEEVKTLVQKIAERFGLNQADVQAVFDKNRQEHMAQMEVHYEAKLSQFVKDGKITEAQKQLIIAKRKEVEAKREATRANRQNMTAEQRKAAMDAEKSELDAWAKQNNIDVKYLFGGMGKWGMRMKVKEAK